MQLVFKQNRPLWERAFLGALFTCNGLVCSLQSHLCSFFSFLKDKKTKSKKKTKQKNNKLHLTPSPWGVQSCFFFFFFVFLVSWCFAFLVRCYFEGLAKKWQDLTLCHFSPLGIANLFVVVSACFRSLVPLETM